MSCLPWGIKKLAIPTPADTWSAMAHMAPTAVYLDKHSPPALGVQAVNCVVVERVLSQGQTT